MTTNTRDVLFKWNKDNISRLRNGVLKCLWVWDVNSVLTYCSLPIRE